MLPALLKTYAKPLSLIHTSKLLSTKNIIENDKMTNPNQLYAAVLYIPLILILVSACAVVYFQISDALKEETEEIPLAEEIRQQADKTANIVFKLLIPGGVSIFVVILVILRYFGFDLKLSNFSRGVVGEAASL